MREDLYRLKRPSDQSLPLWVHLAGTSYCDHTYRMTRLKSWISVVEYILNGHGTVVLNGQRYDVCPGDIFILPQGTDHDYWAAQADPFTKCFFNVEGEFLPVLLRMFGLEGKPVLSDTGTLPYFEEGLTAIKERTIKWKDLQVDLSIILHRIIATAARTLEQQNPGNISPEMRFIKNYMDMHLSEKLSVNGLAEKANLSAAQFTRNFRNAFGTTPYDYLLNGRLEQARLLLENTRRAVKDIAYDLGFSDEYHFSAFFRKKQGVCPREFRGRRMG